MRHLSIFIILKYIKLPMIKKTMTITSIAILIAAVSVAATITMIQADPEAGTKATFELVGDLTTPHSNPALGGDLVNHIYDDVSKSDPGTVQFTPIGSIAIGNFDAAEPIFQDGGGPPVPGLGSPLTLFNGASPFTTPFNAVVGHEEAAFTFTAPNPGQNYFLGTTISDMDDFGLALDAGGVTKAPETVFVSVNGVNLATPVTAVPGSGLDQTITTAHGVVKALPAGGLVVGFNEIFTWDPIGLPVVVFPVCGNIGVPLPCIGDETGIRVEQITVIQASQSTGFWKNHEDVVDTLTDGMEIDLLDDGTILINDDSGIESDDIFQGTKKTKGDARPQLAAQLLAAQLNIKNGAVSCTEATDAITAAQTALKDLGYTGTLGDGTKPTGSSSPTKSEVNGIKGVLDDYNNNLLCPPP